MAEELQNTLSWSRSRMGTLRSCPRQYYYSYYGSWGGWSDEADPRTRRIYLLKQLRGRPAWAGETVHAEIERLLQELRATGEAPPLQEVLKGTRDRMREAFKLSRDAAYLRRPKLPALFEHEYALPVTPEQWRETATHVDACLTNLYESETFRALRALPEGAWLELEGLGSFDLDGVPVHVKLDLAFRDADGVVLVDWKTGRRESAEHEFQLGLYTLYAVHEWGIDPSAVRALEVNLFRKSTREHRFDEQALERIEDQVSRSVAHMRDLLRDADRNLALEEDFPLKDEERLCNRCNFLEVCDSRWAGRRGVTADRM